MSKATSPEGDQPQSGTGMLSRPGGMEYTILVGCRPSFCFSLTAIKTQYVLPPCGTDGNTIKDPWSLEATMFIQQVAKSMGVGIRVNDGGLSLSVHSFSQRKATQTCAALDSYF